MSQLWELLGPMVLIGVIPLVVVAAAEVIYRVLLRAGRRIPLLDSLARRAHRPAQLELALLAAIVAVNLTIAEDAGWRGPVLHSLLVAAIGAGGWLVTALLLVLMEAALTQFRTSVADNLEARRARTQVLILRRLAVAVIAVVTIGIALTTFPSVRAVGTSVLASAGLIGVVAGLAAQSTLGNLFAGLQVVFSDALRIDDVVVVEDEWGRIEELTLGYVVVKIWDQRRLILPTSYFTTKPYRHWTRTESAILGTVHLDVDWTVPIPALRAELERFCAEHPLWDGRTVGLQLTDATGATIRVRALMSAEDGSKIWDLRCAVREHLVEWVRVNHPEALPHVRANVRAAADELDASLLS